MRAGLALGGEVMIVFDTGYDPLHFQGFPSRVSIADAEAHFDALEHYYETRTSMVPAALLADARRLVTADARVRRRIATAFERLSPVLADRAVGHAVVVYGPVVRHALTAIFWFKKPSWPVRVFTDMAEADAWLRAAFVERGLPAPEAPARWWTATRE
jgi:hypothetical protein